MLIARKMKREAELGQVHLGNVGVRLRVQVRQERAELLPALAARVVRYRTWRAAGPDSASSRGRSRPATTAAERPERAATGRFRKSWRPRWAPQRTTGSRGSWMPTTLEEDAGPQAEGACARRSDRQQRRVAGQLQPRQREQQFDRVEIFLRVASCRIAVIPGTMKSLH